MNVQQCPLCSLERVQFDRPFSVVGIDFAGPLTCKTYNPSSLSYIHQPAHILLITCTATRALHLEVTTHLNAESYILALRNFIASRGCPNEIISDNFKTFKSRAVVLFNAERRIKQSFITPYAPWEGGFYERLVALVKRCLRKILGRSLVKFNELSVIVKEIELILNSRPLCSNENDVSELAITPNRLIFGYNPLLQSNSVSAEGSSASPSCLSRQSVMFRQAYLHRLIQSFVKRWKIEYLQSLRERPNNHGTSSTICIGDIVLIESTGKNRMFWPMAKIVDVKIGRDQNIRTASAELYNSHINSKVQITRPVGHFYKLEVGV